MENIVVLLLALVVDVILGEYPRPIHPVVWMGKLISAELRLAPRRGPRAQLFYGAAIVLLTVGAFAGGTYFLLDYLREVSMAAYIPVAVFLVKSTFSIKELNRVALKVKDFIEGGNLNEAKGAISSLVSRDTSQLDRAHVVSATVESAAENASDSFVAPLFFFLLFGVTGAIAYRAVNTLDAMIGYHGGYEYLGKFAARLDDVLNFIPARICALLIVLSAYVCRENGRQAWKVMLRDHGRTESPNAGWPMSAAAGALSTRLEKTGQYQLGDPNTPLTFEMIPSVMRLVNVTAAVWLCVCLALKAVWFEFGS